MSCEIGFLSDEVSRSFLSNLLDIERQIKSCLERHDYGPSISHLGIIPTMYPQSMHDDLAAAGRPVKERKLLRNGDVDYRLFIDHADFLAGSEQKRRLLILDNVIRVIQDLKRRVKKDFDGEALERDIRLEFGLPADGNIL